MTSETSSVGECIDETAESPEDQLSQPAPSVSDRETKQFTSHDLTN